MSSQNSPDSTRSFSVWIIDFSLENINDGREQEGKYRVVIIPTSKLTQYYIASLQGNKSAEKSD